MLQKMENSVKEETKGWGQCKIIGFNGNYSSLDRTLGSIRKLSQKKSNKVWLVLFGTTYLQIGVNEIKKLLGDSFNYEMTFMKWLSNPVHKLSVSGSVATAVCRV